MMPSLHAKLIAPLGESELPASYCGRLAHICGRDARDFCLDMGFKFQDIVDGIPSVVQRLEEISGLAAGALQTALIVRVGPRLYELNGEPVNRTALTRSKVRVCPFCIRDDRRRFSCTDLARPYQRSWWLLGHIRTCHVHERALVEIIDGENPHSLHDFTRVIRSQIGQLDGLMDQSVSRPLSKLEAYLHNRINQAERDATWLDTLRLDVAARVCEMIGASDILGAKFRVLKLSEAQWYESGGRGYEIAATGEVGIRKFLSDLQMRFGFDKKAAGPKSVFFRLYEWLAHQSKDEAYDPLRDIITRHSMETMPLGPGDEIFGNPVQERKMHSIRSASLQYGCHPKRLRKILIANGFVADADASLVDDQVLFEAATSEPFIKQLVESVSMKDAAAYLNVPRPVDRALVENGIIKPIAGTDAAVLTQYAFVKADLDEFLERLLRDATDLQSDEEGLFPLLAAKKRACCTTLEIIQLILDRKLTRVRKLPGERGFMSVLVDMDEVLPLVRKSEHGGVSLRQTEKLLGVSTGVLMALLENNVVPSRTDTNPINRCPQTVVDQEHIEIFKATYVSLIKLAQETGVHFNVLKKQLESANVPLAFDRERIGGTFYHRATLPPI
ncbi:hypothetical protein J2X72_001439 [Phyllobacterium sp. 1468]|uniref:TniQ family protein n=1 Tax=Phyllobacterium sp. 1468 TaxID=2817759 RepID=UPI00285C42FE|nr:TniQ family protein [Phyllobacterium sp. 1468]MDR6632655.1 hypothetical protein [Phyllobacterium sp. 1468]